MNNKMRAAIINFLTLFVSDALALDECNYAGYDYERDAVFGNPRYGEAVYQEAIPVTWVHKVTPQNSSLVKPENANNGFHFVLDWDKMGDFIFQANAGGVGSDTQGEPIANCEVVLTSGKTTHMNLTKVRADKAFYIKDTSGKGKYVIYKEGGSLEGEASASEASAGRRKKKGVFGLFGSSKSRS